MDYSTCDGYYSPLILNLYTLMVENYFYHYLEPMEVSMSAINVTIPMFGRGTNVIPRFEEIFAAGPVKAESTELEKELISMIRAESRALQNTSNVEEAANRKALIALYQNQLTLCRKAMRSW